MSLKRENSLFAKRFGNEISSLWIFWLCTFGALFLVLSAIAVIALPSLADFPLLISLAIDTEVRKAFFITFLAAGTAIGSLVLLATPVAYILSQTTSLWRGGIETLLDIPLILPHTVAGLMVYLLFMSRGPIGSPFATIGFVFEDAFWGIVIAMIFVSMPYYLNAVRGGFERVPVHMHNVARTLGATPMRVFLHIVLPLSSRAILYGSLLSLGRAVGEFAAVVMIAYFPLVISTMIYERFATGGIAESRGIAFLMVIICLIIFLIFRILTRRAGLYDTRA